MDCHTIDLIDDRYKACLVLQFLCPLVLHTHIRVVLKSLKSDFKLHNTTFFQYRKPNSTQMHPVSGGGKREGSCKM